MQCITIEDEYKNVSIYDLVTVTIDEEEDTQEEEDVIVNRF